MKETKNNEEYSCCETRFVKRIVKETKIKFYKNIMD